MVQHQKNLVTQWSLLYWNKMVWRLIRAVQLPVADGQHWVIASQISLECWPDFARQYCDEGTQRAGDLCRTTLWCLGRSPGQCHHCQSGVRVDDDCRSHGSSTCGPHGAADSLLGDPNCRLCGAADGPTSHVWSSWRLGEPSQPKDRTCLDPPDVSDNRRASKLIFRLGRCSTAIERLTIFAFQSNLRATCDA